MAAAVEALLSTGHEPEEIALVSPTPGRSSGALARALAARGVPFDAGRGAPLADAPVVRLVREALAAAGETSRSAAERLLGSAWLARPGATSPSALLDRAGALDGRAPPAAALRRRAAALGGGASAGERAALLRAAEAVDGLTDLLRPLAAAGTAREHAAHLSAFLARAGIRRRAARGEPALVARDLAALRGLDDAAEAVVRAAALLGDAGAQLTPAAFRARLDLALEEAALPPPASAAAGAVELSGPSEAPGLSARAVVITGCVRGSFPAAPPPEPLLREPERLALCRHLRRPAVATSAARRAEALHRAFTAVAAGREAVAFVWAAPGPDGGGGPPSPLVAEALAAAGVELPDGPAPEPALAAARTPRAALRAAARLGASGAAALGGTGLEARALDALARGAVEAERGAAVQAREAAPHAGRIDGAAASPLCGRAARRVGPHPARGVRALPFRAFLALVLRLPDRAAGELDIDPARRGQPAPRGAGALRGGADRPRAPGRRTPARRTSPRRARPRPRSSGASSGRAAPAIPAAWAGRREAVLARLDRVVRAEARDHDGLVPAAVELRFGSDAPHPPLSLTAGGETVRLKGRVDRMDAAPGRLLVIDYKNARSGAPTRRARAGGARRDQLPGALPTSWRPPARCRAAAARGRPTRSCARRPACRRSRSPRTTRSSPPTPAPRRSRVRGRPFAAAVVGRCARSGPASFPIASRSCDGCGYGAVCRFQGTAALAAEGEGEGAAAAEAAP